MMNYNRFLYKCGIEFNYEPYTETIKLLKPILSETDFLRYKYIMDKYSTVDDHSEAWNILLKYKDMIIFHSL